MGGVMAMGRMTTPGATLATSRLRRRSVPSRGLCFSIRPLHNSWADLEGEILSLTPSHTIPSTTQVGFDSKPGGTNSFPNQLISLSQIRNYAHQPDMLHSLKEKVTQEICVGSMLG